MIKVKIVNDFDKCLEEHGEEELREDMEYGGHIDPTNPFLLKPYDKEEFKDGRVVEFENLRDVETFRKDADNSINYTEEHTNTFCQWDWQEIDIYFRISDSEDNTLILIITAHDEWRD